MAPSLVFHAPHHCSRRPSTRLSSGLLKTRTVSRGQLRQTRCGSGNFFFRPARNCGGQEDVEAPPVDEELQKRLSQVEGDSVRCHVSDDAMDAILNTTSRLTGLAQAGFQLQVVSDYSEVSGLLLSSVCTGYQLHGAEKRMQLHNVLQEPDAGSGLDVPLSPEKLEGIDEEVQEYISSLEKRLQAHPRKNPVTSYICSMETMSPLDAALSTRAEVRQAIMEVVRRKMAEFGSPEPELDKFWGTYKEQPLQISQKRFLDAIEYCMMIGYHIHRMEDNLSLERCLNNAGPRPRNDSIKKSQSSKNTSGSRILRKFPNIFRHNKAD